MKKFIVDTGKKKYIVKAKDAKRAVELIKKTDDNAIDDSPKITQLSRNFGRVRVLERNGYFEIEWPTLGKVYTEEAEQFLRDLQNAMNYVNKMKARFGYK